MSPAIDDLRVLKFEEVALKLGYSTKHIERICAGDDGPKVTSRVAERNLTSPPSQIRTGHSRVIRLLPPSLRPHTLFPQDK